MNEIIENILNKSISEYTDIYRGILQKLYPAIGSSGFEERNLTNNFVNALKIASDNDSIAWFETSLQGNEKIDATVFLPQNNSVFFIEAKRITNGKENIKLNEICSDFVRLMNPENQAKILGKWVSNIKIENKYIIYLADVWKENSITREIPNKWIENGINLNDNTDKLIADKLNKSNIILSKVVDFSIYKREFQYPNSLENYNLLIFVYKIF
jgi:hypothetical protein